MTTTFRAGESTLTFDQAYDFFRRHGLRLLLGILLGAIVAVIVANMLPKRWESTATLELGRTYTNGSISLVESSYQTAARVRLRAFQNEVLTTLGLPLEPEPSSELLRDSLDAQVVRDTELLELEVRAESPEQAGEQLDAVIQLLQQIHGEMLEPTLIRVQREQLQVEGDLERALQRRDELLRMVDQTKGASGEPSASGAMLLSSMTSTNDALVLDLQRRKTALAEQLDPARSFNTRVLGSIEVSRHPVFPKRLLMAAAGAVLGFLLVFALVVLRDYQRSRSRSTA